MSPQRVSLRPVLSAVAATALVAAAAAALRAHFVESETLAPLCLEAAAPWWCGLRTTVEEVGKSPTLGLLSLAAALLAYFGRLPRGLTVGSAVGGLLAGVTAIAFGAALFAGPACVIGLLALVRQDQR